MSRVPFLFLLVALAVAPAAADPDPLSETVTVTAARTSLPIDEIGSTVTIIDREEIESRQAQYLSDLLRGVPGIAVARSGGPGSVSQARIRGAEANHVLVLIDGVAVNDAFAADEIPLELLTSYDIERVEIVTGPQSGVWGADALAGVINVVTRRDLEGGEAEVEGGSFGTTRGGGRIAGRLGAVGVSFTGSVLDSDGTNVSRTGGEDDGASNGTAALRLAWAQESGPFDLDVSARHTDASAEFDGVDAVTTGLPIDADNETDTTLSLLQATGRWAGDGSAWSHELRASVAASDTDTLSAGLPAGSTAIDKTAFSFQSSVDLGAASSLERRLTLAVDREDRRFEQRGEATPFGDPNQDRSIDTTGGVVELRVGRPGSWSLTGDVRHDTHSDFADETTWRVTGSWSPWRATRLRASVGTGHKPPTFIERFGFFSDTFVGNPDLEPETSTGWEVGLDRDLGRDASAGVTYFRARLDNEINGFVFDPGLGAFTARNEDATSDRQGVEVRARADVGRTTIAASYTFTDATQPDGAAGDERELRRPRHMANLRVAHAFARVPLEAQVNAAYVGSRTDLYFPPFPTPSERVTLDDYVLVDLSARYRVGARFDLVARIENALDEDYEDVYGFATPGVGAWVGVRFHAGG